jgi:hypothetical protein
MTGQTPTTLSEGKVKEENRVYLCCRGRNLGKDKCRIRRVKEFEILRALAAFVDTALTNASDREAVVRQIRGLCKSGDQKQIERATDDLAKLDKKIALNTKRCFDAPNDAAYADLVAELSRRKAERVELAERVRVAEESDAALADADCAADAVARAAKRQKGTLMLHGNMCPTPSLRLIFRRLFECVVVEFQDEVIVNPRRKKEADYNGTIRSKATAFRITAQDNAFTPKGLSALASEASANDQPVYRAGSISGSWQLPQRRLGLRQHSRQLPRFSGLPISMHRRAGND